MNKSGLNSWKSWLITVACCIVYCLFVPVQRLQSLFYVAVVEEYNIKRESASIPFVVLGLTRCISGFIFGMLGERFGLQRITYFGCFLSVLGVGMSYFAQNVLTLTITIGLIYGFGMTGAALLPNIIREHFDDTATTLSNGLVNIGPCLAATIFSGPIMHIIDKYGVSGAFLLSSGIILNSLPLIMMLKPKSKRLKCSKIVTKKETKKPRTVIDLENKKLLHIQSISLNKAEDIVNHDNKRGHLNENRQTDLLVVKTSTKNTNSSFNKEKFRKCSLHSSGGCNCARLSLVKNKIQYFYDQHGIEKDSPKEPEIDSEEITNNLNWQSIHEVNKSSHFKPNLQELRDICEQDNAITANSVATITAMEKEKKNGFFYALNVFKDPAFMAITVVQGLYVYNFFTWVTTQIDYSRDKGIDRSYEIYILTLNPITDIAGRVCLAWVTDKNYLSLSSFGALLHFLLAISIICTVLATDFAIMMLGLMLMTFAMGAYLSICPGLCYALIEKDKQAVTIASFGLFYAPLSFTVSPLIGYFRGKLGSYDGLYYLLAVMHFASSLIVLSLPKLAKMREQRKIKMPKDISLCEIT